MASTSDLYRACEGLLAALDRAMDYIGNGWQPQDIVDEAREARNQAELFMARACDEYEAPRDPSHVLRVRGVGRSADEPRAFLVALTERPTDDEIRSFHDSVREWRLGR